MTLSGALAGLGGANFVLGYKHFFEQGFSGGVGFLGIAVALLGRNHPAGVLIAAFFFGVPSVFLGEEPDASEWLGAAIAFGVLTASLVLVVFRKKG